MYISKADMLLVPRDDDMPFDLNYTLSTESSIDHPVETNGPLLTISAITLMTVTFLIVSARIYSRKVLLGFMGADDYCIIFATVAAIGLVSSACLTVNYGVGKHVWDVPFLDFVEIAKLAYISQVLYLTSLGLTKASLSLLLLRLSPSPVMLRITWTIFGFTTAFTISAVISSIFQCAPISYGWKRLDSTAGAEGECVDYIVLQYSILGVNLFTDIIVWLLPLKLILQVSLPPKQKLGLYFIFGLGGLIPVSAIIRLVVIIETMVLSPGLADPSWSAVNISVWSIVEVTVAIMCSSVPVMRPLLKNLVPTLIGSLNSLRSGSKSRHSGYQSWAIGKRVTTVKDSIPLGSVEQVNGAATTTESKPTGMVMANVEVGVASYYDNHSVDFPVPGSSHDHKAGNEITEVTVQSSLKEEV